MSGALAPLRGFVRGMERVLDHTGDEPTILAAGKELLAELVASDEWLPASHAGPDIDHYCQYLLYSDPLGRFSVVSFVWGPGQQTPIHDHTVWGLIGMLRGSEVAEGFMSDAGGLHATDTVRLGPGEVDAVSPSIGDLHRVANAHDDRVSISIHVYGADIGTVRRWTYDVAGTAKPFVSGYAPAPALSL